MYAAHSAANSFASTQANNKYKYPMNNEKVGVRKKQQDFLANQNLYS